MKGYLVFVLFIMISPVKSQPYYPFPDSFAIWTNGLFWGGNEDPLGSDAWKVFINGDSIHNGLKYARLFRSDEQNLIPNEFIGLIREDSIKRIFLYIIYDTTESLLYQFGLAEGDTIPIITEYSTFLIVAEVDSIDISGQTRKSYNVHGGPPGNVRNTIWVEGIGSLDGLIGHLFSPFESSLVLLCFESTEINYYSGQGDTSCWVTGIENRISPESKILIHPNPAHDDIHIQSISSFIYINAVRLLSITGQEIASILPLQNAQQVSFNTSHLPVGLYFCSTTLNSGETITERIIIE